MSNQIFNLCVALLQWAAGLLGMSYEGINVLIFCILWPLLTLGLVVVVWRQYIRLRMWRRMYWDVVIMAAEGARRPR